MPQDLSQQTNQEFTSVKHFSLFCGLKEEIPTIRLAPAIPEAYFKTAAAEYGLQGWPL